MNRVVCMFPGQGSQFVGMASDLKVFPCVQKLFKLADDILQRPLTKIMEEGPAEILADTRNAQSAVFLHSWAIVEVLRHHYGIDLSTCKYALGHSLGEYTALCLAKVLTFEQTLRVLKHRSEAMYNVDHCGVMCAFWPLSESEARNAVLSQIIEKRGVCEIGCINSPNQLIFSGSVAAISHLRENANEIFGKRVRSKMLATGGAFHSSLMVPATEEFSRYNQLPKYIQSNQGEINGKIKFLSSISGQTEDLSNTRRISHLLSQIHAPIRWKQCIDHCIASESDLLFIEVGPGTQLTSIMRDFKSHQSIAVNSAATLSSFQL